MSYREFVKPRSIKVKQGDPTSPTLVDYHFENFLAEVPWTYAKWKEDDWADAQVRIGEVVEETEAGKPMRFESDDWDKLAEACKEVTIGGRYAHKLRFFARIVRSAARVAENGAAVKASDSASA